MKKAKCIFAILLVLMLFSTQVVVFAGVNAEPSTAKILINGVERSFEAYSVKGSNYFKPNDLAIALNGQSKGFDIVWNETQGAFNISKNKPYSGVNTEIKQEDGIAKNAEVVSSKLIVDGEEIQLEAYNINSEIYFKLQDIMKIADIQVAWNNKKAKIVLDSAMGYNDAPKPLSGFVICVDPGHGNSGSREKEPIAPNSDVLKPAFVSGTSGSAYTEAEINLAVAIMLKEKLIAQGATVIMTREGTEATLSNIGRAKFANDANADLAIRIHCDGSTSSQASGMSMLVPGKQYVSEALVDSSYAIGESVLNKVIEYTAAKSRGLVLRDDLTGFNWSTVPSILIEMGFLTNPQEDALLSTSEYQDKITSGITDAVVELYKGEINKAAPVEAEKSEAELILNDRINAYMEQNPGISLEETTWKVKVDLDKPEFTDANILNKEQLQSISVIVNKRNRVPDDYVPDDLVKITERVSLRNEAKVEYDRMVSDAQIEGYRITPISGFRSIDYQRNLYNRYLKRDSLASVETYSARAGFSEHHTGLAIDVGGASNNMSTFKLSREYPWVVDNGYKYGFIIRYLSGADDITGYMSEPWHLRYVGTEIATIMNIEGIRTLEEYAGKYLR